MVDTKHDPREEIEERKSGANYYEQATTEALDGCKKKKKGIRMRKDPFL